MCARNISQTSMERLLIIAPGRVFHTWRSHCWVPASSIQPFGWACTMTPGVNLTPFGNVFHLKITTGFSFFTIGHARKDDCEVSFLVASCLNEYGLSA